MRSYTIRRLLLLIPTFLLVTLIVFLLVRLIPGSIVDLMILQQGCTISSAQIEHALGLDVPFHIQYVRWLEQMVLHGNLGNSLWRGTPVTTEILSSLPVTLELGLLGIITALTIAVPIGIYSAIRQDTAGDYLGRTLAILCISLPSFWLGTLAMVLPAIWWSWSPPVIYVSIFKDTIENLAMFIIPGFILGMVLSGVTMRMMRTMMLEVLRQDYIRTAWSKGLTEGKVITRHALKNALIPVVTIVGLQVPILVGGTVVLEQIFCLPGVGRLLLEALNKRDYPIVSGVNVFLSLFIIIVNLLVDLTYGWLDPRIKFA